MTMFTVIGPDDIPIRDEPFDTKEEAEAALAAFVERFRQQGYYATANGYRIPCDAIADTCDIIEGEWEPVTDDERSNGPRRY